jgi:hypothetical protein
MPSVKRRMSKILDEYGAAQSELIGKAAGLIDGKAGTVENVWPDECTGFGFSSEVYEGRWPVSTIKLVESWTSHWPRVARIARSSQSIPIKMKSPISARKVTLMIVTVRNTSLAESGFINASHLAKPRE